MLNESGLATVLSENNFLAEVFGKPQRITEGSPVVAKVDDGSVWLWGPSGCCAGQGWLWWVIQGPPGRFPSH